MFDRAVKNSFAPIVKSIAEDAGSKWDAAIANGFPIPTYLNDKKETVELTKAEYVRRAVTEYQAILNELTETL